MTIGRVLGKLGESKALDLEKGRIALLDELRGAAIVLMFICHIAYDCYLLTSNTDEYYRWFGQYAAPFTAGIFTIIAGICTCYSRNSVRRGAILLGIALLITVVTIIVVPELRILFGVLHMLGCCMLLTGLLAAYLDHLPSRAGMMLSLLLFLIAGNLSWGYIGFGQLHLYLPMFLYRTGWLFPLGFHTTGFFSADYYPLMPWLFLFLTGRFAGSILIRSRLPEWVYKSRVSPLAWLGRHSLTAYLIHQPLFLPLLWLGAELFR